MYVMCDKCGLVYDDTYRWTFCYHREFKKFRFEKSSSEYLSNVEELSMGDKDFSMALMCCGITENNKEGKS